MRNVQLRVFSAVLVVLGFASRPGAARAETVNCTPVTSVPTTISTSGVYCLTGDLSTADPDTNAIVIAANNVILDLNGHKLGGLAAGPGTSSRGIYAAYQQNITIRNGTIRGFAQGIFIDGPYYNQGHVIEDIRADQNTLSAIGVRGRGVIIRRNLVVATGGSTLTGSGGYVIGIFVSGDGVRVIDNDVITVTKVGSTGAAWGISIGSSNGALVENNRITVAERGIEFSSSTGKYRNNLTSSVITPYTGGTDAGNNN